MNKYNTLFACLLMTCFSAVAQKPAVPMNFKVDYEKFKLANGLEVVFHIDRSDPVVAVSLTAHVGSAREKQERTGFAHLFEHLLFLESENLGKGGLDKMTARIGGSGANGSTNRDRTNYLQTVPKDALEKMIWAEADKLGWFINTVTEPVLAKEKQVVKNEKRQSVDNNPYGHTEYLLDSSLYPKDHPYNWQVIGSLADLQNATLADVKEFFRKWYVPNNVTLVLAGDFDKTQARQWVQKYFGEIKRGAPVPAIQKRPGVVNQVVKLYHEDNFARLPELTMAWPTVENYHPDSYAMDVLAEYLSTGKHAPFYKMLVEDKKLTAQVDVYNYTSEIAGQMHLSVRAFQDKDLDEVAKAVQETFALFERTGISANDLKRIKAGQETQFYNSLSSVLGKGTQLAQYNIFAGDPGFLTQDVKRMQAVTAADVMRVYNKYIKGRNYVATSFVPKGKMDLALNGSAKANVVEEAIVQGAEDAVDASANASYPATPSTFDRSKEPPYGPAPQVKVPAIWTQQLSNGIKVFGIENNEVPLLQYEIVMDGGQLLEDINNVGVANLLAQMMTQGTRTKTAVELEDAIKELGASINVSAATEDIRVRVNTLARNYPATLKLVQEILLEPRWDENEFTRLKQSTISQVRQQEASPNSIAQNQFNVLLYGKDHMRAKNILGTVETINAITLDDLKEFYKRSITPAGARMHVVGDLNKTAVTSSLAMLDKSWKGAAIKIPAYPVPQAPAKSQIYFYDVPDAKQSVIRIGYPALAATDADFYPATVMNYILGGGGFASQLTQQLREGKGYTYGINSNFTGTAAPGPFVIGSGVRTNVTLESAELIKKILQDFGKNYSAADMETTKSFIQKSSARNFETFSSKLNMLENISKYGWKNDYINERLQIVKDMTVPRIQALAGKYLNPDKMIWFIAGDAKTQLPRLTSLGFGEPVLINK